MVYNKQTESYQVSKCVNNSQGMDFFMMEKILSHVRDEIISLDFFSQFLHNPFQ